MKYKYIILKWVAILLLAAIFISMLCGIVGCSFARKMDKTETKKDSVVVSTIDSAWLKTLIENSTASKASGSELRVYQPAAPGVNNYFSTPSTDNSQLLAVLTNWQHENESKSKETIDSGAFNKKDTTNVSIKEFTKSTETETKLPWLQYVTLALVVIIGIKVFSPFKITRV